MTYRRRYVRRRGQIRGQAAGLGGGVLRRRAPSHTIHDILPAFRSRLRDPQHQVFLLRSFHVVTNRILCDGMCVCVPCAQPYRNARATNNAPSGHRDIVHVVIVDRSISTRLQYNSIVIDRDGLVSMSCVHTYICLVSMSRVGKSCAGSPSTRCCGAPRHMPEHKGLTRSGLHRRVGRRLWPLRAVLPFTPCSRLMIRSSCAAACAMSLSPPPPLLRRRLRVCSRPLARACYCALSLAVHRRAASAVRSSPRSKLSNGSLLGVPLPLPLLTSLRRLCVLSASARWQHLLRLPPPSSCSATTSVPAAAAKESRGMGRRRR